MERNEENLYLKVEDLEKIFKVSPYTIRRWARRGDFGAFKKGKCWYFVEELVRERAE